MAGQGRGGGRCRNGGKGWDARGRGCSIRPAGRGTCACEANAPLLVELRTLDEECLRSGKVKLRHGLKRAMNSLERYPLPVTTEKEACALEGVGTFTARRMLRGLLTTAMATDGGSGTAADSSGGQKEDEENFAPTGAGGRRGAGSRGARRGGGRVRKQGGGNFRSVSASAEGGCASKSKASLLRMNLRPGGSTHAFGAAPAFAKPVSLAKNFAALRGDDDFVNSGDDGSGGDGDGTQTPDVNPRRVTSRAKREEVGGGGGGGYFGQHSSKAPRYFSGPLWEACLLIDNRERDFLAMQSTLLQKGVLCETRQLPLGDMLWIARQRGNPTSEVLLGYIVERKTVPDLASSIIDGRYDEQKRRLKLSGLRRRIYLVEGNLNYAGSLAPSTIRTALASTQACEGLAVVQSDSLHGSIEFLARTHRHIASLLSNACHSALVEDDTGGERGGGRGGRSGLWPSGEGAGEVCVGDGAGGGVSSGSSVLKPAMTYGEYAQGCAKRAGFTTVRQLLGAMMRQIPGCSAARAEAVVRAFESPLGLMLTLERAAEGERAGGGGRCSGGDDDAARMQRVDEVLAGLVCQGGAGTNKLPRPMRQLMCRLFVGESVGVDSRSCGDADEDDEYGMESEAEVDVGGEQTACGASVMDIAAGLPGGDPNPYCGWDVEPMSQDDPHL